MELIGHLAVIEEAGVVAGEELWGAQAVVAMLPNLAHCHEWAYEALWDVHRRTDAATARVVQAHMICDWVIHYGPDWTPVQERIGWAYEAMPTAVAQLDRFMDHLVDTRLVREDPRHRDSRDHLERDFGHTAVECALDFVLAERYAPGPRLASICREFQRFAEPDTAADFIADTFRRLGGYTKKPPAVLRRTVDEYGRWSTRVQHPYEFSAYMLLSKYDIDETPAALEFMTDFLRGLAHSFDPSDRERMTAAIVERIADPERCIPGSGRGPARGVGTGADVA